jgi:hypothetical protein
MKSHTPKQNTTWTLYTGRTAHPTGSDNLMFQLVFGANGQEAIKMKMEWKLKEKKNNRAGH